MPSVLVDESQLLKSGRDGCLSASCDSYAPWFYFNSSLQSYLEYERRVSVLINEGLAKDASMVWWDTGPRTRFPELETWFMNVSTNVKHALGLVALNVCLLHILVCACQQNQSWLVYVTELIDEKP